MKSKAIILSLCIAGILSLNIFNFSLFKPYPVDLETTRPPVIINYGIEPGPTRP